MEGCRSRPPGGSLTPDGCEADDVNWEWDTFIYRAEETVLAATVDCSREPSVCAKWGEPGERRLMNRARACVPPS
jgi:hypothetical protein